MRLTVRASKGIESIDAPRSSPIVAVAYARALLKAGWTVVITDAAGRHYTSASFDELLAPDPTEEVRVSSADTVTQFRRRSD